MNRIPVLLIMVLMLSSGCRKASNNLIWEKSFGPGKALFINATPDSGLISCGQMSATPYMLKLDRNKKVVSEYKYGENGLFSSGWSDENHFIAIGSTKSKMLISCLDNQNVHKWDTALTASFNIDFSVVFYLGNGELLGIASANPDSANNPVTGLYCVWFDTTGAIGSTKEIKESTFFSANRIVVDNSGNIYVAASRKSVGTEVRSTVIKYNGSLQKIWETELYNNPSFAASTRGIIMDNSGNIYVSGSTKIATAKETIENSVAASLTSSGSVRWKKYLEIDNSASSVIIDDNSEIFILDKNCFIINVLDPTDGTANGLIRTFDACDSKSTDSYARDFCFNYDNNIALAGERNGNFYITLKSPVFQQIAQ